MATNTKTLDENLRERERKALKQALADAGKRYWSEVERIQRERAPNRGGYVRQVPTLRYFENDQMMPHIPEASRVFSNLEAALFEHIVKHAEDRAVAEFVNQVDSLSSQVEELEALARSRE